ncbi:MAG: exodeoxyribonuclease III [Candidatus Symbiobacter sp.]|nr:exodeoxyribonuclease III [Candidatus Symbiobacter sp.]
MLIATWNVNSVRARAGHVHRYLTESAPDILMLQEIKCQAADFPRDALPDGYQVEILGQKAYHGVAIIARHPINLVQAGLSTRRVNESGGQENVDESDAEARYLEADIAGIRVGDLYLPNGNPSRRTDEGGATNSTTESNSIKYDYKLRWMQRLTARAQELMSSEKKFLLAGDFNVCPTARDLYDPVGWRDDALFRLDTRREFRRLVNLGLTDAIRARYPDDTLYSFWDYQGGRWSRGEGLRIDHFLLSPPLADRLVDCGIDRTPRQWEQPSDHTPVWCRLD